MLQTRVIPCLLLKGKGLVKTIKFNNPKYIGDPINSVKLFNDKQVDELIFLDITATIEGKKPQFELIQDITSECFMPFSYGGGIKNTEDANRILKQGAEKIILNSYAQDFELIKELANLFGSQSVVISIDFRKTRRGNYEIYTHSGTKRIKIDPLEFIKNVEKNGAGELFVNSVERDGSMLGYDLNLIRKIANKTDIPVVACGGAGSLQDFRDAIKNTRASAVAAGSMFVFHGPHRAVLINYPTQEQIKKTFL